MEILKRDWTRNSTRNNNRNIKIRIHKQNVSKYNYSCKIAVSIIVPTCSWEFYLHEEADRGRN